MCSLWSQESLRTDRTQHTLSSINVKGKGKVQQHTTKTQRGHRGIALLPNYNQQDATFLDLSIFTDALTCFRLFLRPSSGAHNCTYSFRYCQPILVLAATVDEMESSISSTVAASSSIGWQYLKLYVQLCAPDDGRRNRLKHVERL